MSSNAVSGGSFSIRTRYRVRGVDVSKIICHRYKDGTEQYFVRWKTNPEFPVPPRAICSWHPLDELRDALHCVQAYIETRHKPQALTALSYRTPAALISRKRKSPGADPLLSRDGLPTPRDSARSSREPSVVSVSSSSDASDIARGAPDVYNGILERKEGRIVAKKSQHVSVFKANATKLPTPAMVEAAKAAPVSAAERLIREVFYRKLRSVPNVRLENVLDASTPSLDFTFIDAFVLREGVYRADPETNEGCQNPCKPNMGQFIGCEYTKLCTCLEYAAVDERKFERTEPERYQAYLRAKRNNEFVDTAGLPKRFPYERPSADKRTPSTLQAFYREERYPIYECNLNCNCGPVCKSRVVQKGRRVPLTIFKTRDRGWGVCCDESLVKGEFIDTYLGEVITNEEADRREARSGKDKASYLYSLDKFVGGDASLTDDTCYVVDGQYMGSVTRFMNHSCEPNCRQYTVSYNKHDLRVYDLAFFACQDIPAGTELTFDYMDRDEEEEEDVIRKREAAARDPDNGDKKLCNCGATKCRGYLWV